MFVAIGLGLINLSSESTCSSMKRYESMDSIFSSTHSSTNNLNQDNDGVHMAISIDNSSIEANGEGRIEHPPWSIDNIAHADAQKSGWCCG